MKTLALASALALALALAGCSNAQQTAFNNQLITTTQNVVALNNALVQVNTTLIDNLVAQAKLLAPYQCGAYALASAIISDSSAAAKVNALIKSSVAANVGSVAVVKVCAALGYPTSVSATTSATPIAAGK
jgi:hypothetical protein